MLSESHVFVWVHTSWHILMQAGWLALLASLLRLMVISREHVHHALQVRLRTCDIQFEHMTKPN